jgi:hypothetical protein
VAADEIDMVKEYEIPQIQSGIEKCNAQIR